MNVEVKCKVIECVSSYPSTQDTIKFTPGQVYNRLYPIRPRVNFYFICLFVSDIKYIQVGTWSIATYKERQKNSTNKIKISYTNNLK